jgi:enoyl-CoA hydratase/carnithine racemase
MATEFPSAWKSGGLVKSMVEVDEVYEHLKLIESAGWAAPKNHPDLVPPAEAGRLADLFRNLQEGERVRSKPAEFHDWLTTSMNEAEALEAGLLDSNVAKDDLSRRLKAIAASCRDCHVKYRGLTLVRLTSARAFQTRFRMGAMTEESKLMTAWSLT